MLYRENPKNGDKISALGFGAMRLPVNGDGSIDIIRGEEMIRYALENGINYFDTAYPYHSGQSEPFLGQALGAARQRVFLATKMPIMRIKSRRDMELVFDKQRSRLKTDYIDYYMLHSVMDFGQWQQMKKLGIISFVEEKKAQGQIRQIGFSSHMLAGDFKKMLNDYDWDFAQIQYNYLDEHEQAGAGGAAAAKSKGIPLVVMEPLRGGLLADPGPQIADIMRTAEKHKTPAAWALGWVLDHDAFLTVLSGMSTMEQLRENIETAGLAAPGNMTEDDRRVIGAVKDAYRKSVKVPCTGCAYCMPCPQGVRIPYIFNCYNQYYMFGPETARFWYMIRTSGVVAAEGKASACVECGQCESQCPQKIGIIKALKEARDLLETDDFIDRQNAMQEANKTI